jgi:hypothetical protein
VLAQQFLERKRSSTSNILQGLSISSATLEKKSSNDDEFKTNERKVEERKSTATSSMNVPSSHQTDNQPCEAVPSVPHVSQRFGRS